MAEEIETTSQQQDMLIFIKINNFHTNYFCTALAVQKYFTYNNEQNHSIWFLKSKYESHPGNLLGHILHGLRTVGHVSHL